MNKINKFCFPLIIFGVGCVLIGCNLITNIGETTAEITTPIETTAEEEFQECTDEEYKAMTEIINELLEKEHAVRNI